MQSLVALQVNMFRGVSHSGDSTMMHAMVRSDHPADRLCDAIDRAGAPLCVGIDPVESQLPDQLSHLPVLEAVRAFSTGVIDAVASTAAAVKFQSACFEGLGWQGVQLLGELRVYAAHAGLIIVLDAKRGDIGISATQYATAATADGPCDWVTVNSYLGMDGIEPFLDAGLGVFCLVRTSNPSGDAIQSQLLQDGSTVSQSIGKILATAGEQFIGASGWSSLGVVVGATKSRDATELRKSMPNQIFLMPGVGAQGGQVENLSQCFADGHGALIPASRSVIYAPSVDGDWQEGIRTSAVLLAGQLQSAGAAQ